MAESNMGWQDMHTLTTITTKLDGLTHQMDQLQSNQATSFKQVNQVVRNTEMVGRSSNGAQFMQATLYEGQEIFKGDSVNYAKNQGKNSTIHLVYYITRAGEVI